MNRTNAFKGNVMGYMLVMASSFTLLLILSAGLVLELRSQSTVPESPCQGTTTIMSSGGYFGIPTEVGAGNSTVPVNPFGLNLEKTER